MAARAVLGPLEEIRSDDELVALWRERFGPWLPVGWRRWRLPGVPGGWGADVVIRELGVVTLRNLGPAEAAEAVVRARLRVRRWPRVPLLGSSVRALQRGGPVVWLTLVAPPGQSWALTRADFGGAGEYHLAAETVPEPARDPALHDAAIHELAEEESAARPGELMVGSEGEVARQLLELSLADGRFSPAVVEAAVRSVVRAWRRFAIGEENAYHALAALSSYEIAEYARNADLPASVRGVKVVAVMPTPRPALFLRIAAVVQAGDGARERNLWWKLELDDGLEQHWRLVDAYARPELRALRDH